MCAPLGSFCLASRLKGSSAVSMNYDNSICLIVYALKLTYNVSCSVKKNEYPIFVHHSYRFRSSQVSQQVQCSIITKSEILRKGTTMAS